MICNRRLQKVKGRCEIAMDSGLDPFGPMASKGSGRSPQPTDNTTKVRNKSNMRSKNVGHPQNHQHCNIIVSLFNETLAC